MKKVGLVDNKVVVTPNEGSRITYIDKFISKIRSLEKRELMENIIHELKPLSEDIKEDMLKKLLIEEWLIEKKGKIPFLSQKELLLRNTEILRPLKDTITSILANEQEPDNAQLYLMAILHSIKMLKNFTEQGKLGEQEKERMNELLEKDYIAKLIYKAIIKQPNPKSLQMVEMGPPGYMAGMGGLLTR